MRSTRWFYKDFGQALLEDNSQLLDPQGQDYLKRIRAASQRMPQMIDALPNLLHVTRGEMQFSQINMSGLACVVFAEIKIGQLNRT